MLQRSQLESYREQGFLLLPNGLPKATLDLLQVETERLAVRESHEADVLEENGRAIRALHGCHLHSPTMARLITLPEILEPVRQLLDGEVYVYQFKINLKKASVGQAWPWHQDYTHWYEEDGLPSPRILSIAIFLDEVTMDNGPMTLIPGTHARRLDTETEETAGWKAQHRADIRHTIPTEVVEAEVRDHGTVTPIGAAGTVLIFDSLVLHGSGPNLSDQDRRMLVITYNRTDNIPTRLDSARPDFLVGRDFTPLRRSRSTQGLSSSRADG